jgi:hypothetical protein
VVVVLDFEKDRGLVQRHPTLGHQVGADRAGRDCQSRLDPVTFGAVSLGDPQTNTPVKSSGVV